MPIFNVAPYLEDAINSVLHQTYEDFEFLIMDDGSTDNSLAIARAFENQDHRVHVFSRPNRKVAACLNELVALSNGKFIARMDGDDICRPMRFAKQLEFLEHNPNTGVLGSWVQTFGDKEEVWHFRRWDNFSRNLLLFGVTILLHPTWMLRRQLLENHPYNDSFRYIIDREWLARVSFAEPNLEFVALPEVLLDYRMHANSVTGQHKDEQEQRTRTVVEQHLERYGVHLDNEKLTNFLHVCFTTNVGATDLVPYGRLLDSFREKTAGRLPDEFFVFREKWLKFCKANNASRQLANEHVKEPSFSLFDERLLAKSLGEPE